MNFEAYKKTLALLGVMMIAVFMVSKENILNSAPSEMYDKFQHDSEALVVGKIVADKYNKIIPQHARLGFASIDDFDYLPRYIHQGYFFVKNKAMGDYPLHMENISNEEWSRGVAKTYPGFVIKHDPLVDKYVGREIVLQNGERRIMNSVEHNAPYSRILVSGSIIDSNLIDPSAEVKLSGEPAHVERIRMEPYRSQWGIHGILFSKLHNKLSLSLNSLYVLNSLLFALVIAVLTIQYARIISSEFAVIFFITIILSPWTVSFAKNLYWIPFTWFAPAVFAAGYFLSNANPRKWIWLILLYASFLFKCLAGYEYISSIILLASAIFLYELFNPNKRLTGMEAARGFAIVCAVGVAGFATALVMHADMRGDGVLDGIGKIYEFDVKRRTYGDPSVFGVRNFAALSSSPWAIVKDYIMVWRTEFLKFVPGYAFYGLLLGSVATILYRLCAFHRNMVRDAGLFIAFLLPPLSWLVLAKGHSGVHIHMNYVLWYFGFAAAIVQLSFNGLRIVVADIVSWAKTADAKEI